MSVPAPTHGDGVALSIDHPSLSRLNWDLTELVKMAEVQASESALVLSCATRELVIEFLRVSGAMHGRLVGIDSTRLAVQKAVQKLDQLDLLHNVAFINGDTHHLDTVDGLHDRDHVETTFDIIFARNALEPPSHETLLRHWAAYLTPTIGRIVMTYTPEDSSPPPLAGIYALDGDGHILARMKWMLESEWEQTEDNLRALANASGLRVDMMQRLSFSETGVVDMGESMEMEARKAFAGTMDKESEWVNEDGSATQAFKREYLWQVLDKSEQSLRESILAGLATNMTMSAAGEERLAELGRTLKIVPVIQKLGAVLKKNTL